MTTVMFWNLFESGPELLAGDATMWAAQVEAIRRWQPDVLAVTECWRWPEDDSALFRRALHDYGFAHGHLYAAKTGCNMAIMWRDGTEVSDLKGQPWETTFWHGFVRGRVQPLHGSEFTLVLSHLNPFDPTLRRIEGSILRNQMQHLPGGGVLVMDANTVAPGDPEPDAAPSRNLPGSDVADRAPLQGLADVGLVDVGAAAGNRQVTFGHPVRPTPVYHGAQPAPTGVRLDQAWATPDLMITEYRVGDDRNGDTGIEAASDHRPIGFVVA